MAAVFGKSNHEKNDNMPFEKFIGNKILKQVNPPRQHKEPAPPIVPYVTMRWNKLTDL